MPDFAPDVGQECSLAFTLCFRFEVSLKGTIDFLQLYWPIIQQSVSSFTPIITFL